MSTAPVRPRGPRTLTGHFRDLLLDGDASEYGGDRSRARAAYTMASVAAGVSLPDYLTEVLDPANAGSTWWTRKRVGDGDYRARSNPSRLATREYAAARRAYTPPSRSEPGSREVLAAVGVLRATADATAFAPRTASSTRFVLDALFDTAERCGTLLVSVSLRQVAEAARISVGAVSRALLRLRARGGWLRLEVPPTADSAAVYRLLTPVGAGGDGPDALDGAPVLRVRRERSSLLEVLTPSARRVLALLDEDEGRSARELSAQASAPGRSATLAALALLRLRGLASRGADGRYLRDRRGDEAATAEGGDREAIRVERHRADRERFALVRAYYRLARRYTPGHYAREVLLRREARERRDALRVSEVAWAARRAAA